MPQRDDGKGMFSRVVRLMSAPASRHDSGLGGSELSSQFADAEKAELKAMIERKRRNDFVRKRELNMLRRIRREGLTPEQAAALDAASAMDDSEVRGTQPATGGDVGVKAKIDELNTRALPAGVQIDGVADSKALTPRQRERAAVAIRAAAVAIGVGAASTREVEALNPRAASHLAMQRAVAQLVHRRGAAIDFALVDGSPARELTDLIGPHATIVRGDVTVYPIACASIVAKVLRDDLMRRLSKRYPGYGWERNVGYPAPAHIAALDLHGVTPHHRRTFAPVAARLSSAEDTRSR